MVITLVLIITAAIVVVLFITGDDLEQRLARRRSVDLREPELDLIERTWLP